VSGPLELLARLGAAVRGSLADIGDAARLLLRLRALVPAGFFLLILQGISELIKRFAFLKGLIADPNAKDEGPSAEEQLAEVIKKQRGENV
jgi:hypothetical protein